MEKFPLFLSKKKKKTGFGMKLNANPTSSFWPEKITVQSVERPTLSVLNAISQILLWVLGTGGGGVCGVRSEVQFLTFPPCLLVS